MLVSIFRGFRIGNESVPKIIKNDGIDLFFLNCNQRFGNFKSLPFPSDA